MPQAVALCYIFGLYFIKRVSENVDLLNNTFNWMKWSNIIFFILMLLINMGKLLCVLYVDMNVILIGMFIWFCMRQRSVQCATDAHSSEAQWGYCEQIPWRQAGATQHAWASTQCWRGWELYPMLCAKQWHSHEKISIYEQYLFFTVALLFRSNTLFHLLFYRLPYCIAYEEFLIYSLGGYAVYALIWC